MSTGIPTGNGFGAANGFNGANGFSADGLRTLLSRGAVPADPQELSRGANAGTQQGSAWLPDVAMLARIAEEVLAEPPAPGPTGPPAPGPVVVPGFDDDTLPHVPLPPVVTPEMMGPTPGPPGAMADAPTFYFITEHPQAALLAATPPGGPGPFDVETIRGDFPILTERVHGRQLAYLDNAATTHKPQEVIDRLAYFYARENSNVHRGAHALAERATEAYEDARSVVADFLGAPSPDNVVFTRGTTESINLVAQSWGRDNLAAGDEIVLTQLEHHANIVPWQLIAEQTGAVLKVIPVDDTGQLQLDDYAALLTDRTKLVAVSQVSNVLGTIVPVEAVIQAAHRAGARVLVDGAQAVAHMPVDVKAMDADFYAFSGHKVFGPTGIGALYAKPEVLEQMAPWQGGGNMISDVTFERTRYQRPPARFEAGTGNIADAVGLAAALRYLRRLGVLAAAAYEHSVLDYAASAMKQVPGLTMIGTAPDKASVLSFVLDGYEPEEVGSALDSKGIAVRSGHHCAQPVVRRFGHEAVVRPSLAMYNTCAEVDRLVAELHRLSAARGR